MSHHQTISLKEEEEAFTAVRAALRDAHHVFVKGIPPVSAADAVPLTPEQCIQLLDVYLRLILETSDDASAYVLSRTFQTEFLDVLIRYIFQPLVFNPAASTGYASQQSFMDLRSAAAKAVNHILLRATSLGAEGVAASCFRAALDTELMPQLLTTLGNAAVPETIRCSIAEAVFIFILRFGVEGQSLFIQCQGVAAATNALVLDSSTVVRNFCGSLLRELAESFPTEVALPNTISVCLKVLATDSSSDVRILASEVLMLCIRNTTETRYLLLKPHQLLQAIDEQLSEDGGEEQTPMRHAFGASPGGSANGPAVDTYIVRDAVCRLLQTCSLVAFHGAIDSFFSVACDMRLPLKLCRLAAAPTGSSSSRPPRSSGDGGRTKYKASIVTTLRFMVQYTPHMLGIHAMIVNDFPSLSSLLKSVIDAGKQLGHTPASPAAAAASSPQRSSTAAGSDSEAAFDAYCVELSVAVSLLAAQSTTFRRYLQRELLTVPLWATTLKASLLGCLGKASLEFYGSLDMIDATGHHLNALDGIEWSDANKPRRQSVLGVFERQEARVNSGLVAPQSPPPLSEAHSDQEWQRRCRLSFVLLNFAVHLSLSIEDDAAASTTTQLRNQSNIDSSRQSPPPTNNAAAFATPKTPRGVGRPSSSRAGSAAPSRGPLFPNASTIKGSEIGQRSALSPQEREALAVSFDRFNSSFQLTLQLAECYAKKGRDEAAYVSTNDGFVIRSEKLKNPWGPVAEKVSLRSWAVKDVQDGDLFYFAIPFDDLNERSIGIVEERGRRHLSRIKKTMVTVSQNAKGRRWFLYDCVNFVLPRTFNILNELRQMCTDHGEANLRFPVFLFREKEMHLGERCVHPGNIIEVVDQVRFYFSQKPTELVGADDSTIVSLKRKLETLRGRKLQANDEGVVRGEASSDDDDDDGNFRGHGAISSESEGDY